MNVASAVVSDPAGTMGAEANHHVRQSPRKRSAEAQIADFTMMVRVPGQPAAVQVFTDAEEADARGYAERSGGTVVPLPLPMPEGVSSTRTGSGCRAAD